MKILLIGKHGQVGYELQRSLATVGNVVATGRDDLDLTDSGAIEAFVSSVKPDMIVNAAAYTAVDKAETEQALSTKINVDAVATLAQQAKYHDIPLIHYSTDYVFNGNAEQPWRENDTLGPINVYGETKLAGEQAIERSGCQYLILRTSWVYGTRGHNFLLTMRRLGKDKEALSVVADQIGAPTWSRHIADATAQIVAQSLNSEGDTAKFWQTHSGVYHLAASGEGSWYDFAAQIFDDLAKKEFSVAVLSKTTTDAYPTPAKRPLYSAMNTDKLFESFGIRLPGWRESVAMALAEFE